MPPHCDSLDGPVVTAAAHALDLADVDLILPYVPAGSEAEVREAFDRVRSLVAHSTGAADLARRWYFETVVRLHRAGEHAPYTGLKPAGLDVGPVIPLAEKAVVSGDVDDVYRSLAEQLHDQLARRLDRVRQLTPGEGASVATTREYVSAMLGFQVYANHVYQALRTDPHGEHQHG